MKGTRSMSATMDDIVNIVGVQLGTRKVSPQDRIVEDLGGESADLVNIVAAVEDRYAITIDEEDILDIATVSDLVELVRRRT